MSEMGQEVASGEADELIDRELDRAHNLVSTRKGKLGELHSLLGDALTASKELRVAEGRLATEKDQAWLTYNEEVARLDAEMEAAKAQYTQKVHEASQRREAALNKSRSLVGMLAARRRDAVEGYQKAKRIIAKMVSELP